jgi:hypothetical protein
MSPVTAAMPMGVHPKMHDEHEGEKRNPRRRSKPDGEASDRDEGYKSSDDKPLATFPVSFAMCVHRRLSSC